MSFRIAIFMGTRPEAIKMAPVVTAFREAEGFEPFVINSGQHREMIQQVIDLFGISVDAELDTMQANQTLAGLTSRLIERIDQVLADTQPDLVLAQGDTTTVLCSALASFYRKIPIGHVEAGLRTGNMQSPFPEEANRRLVSPLVALHFAPTETARQALLRERYDDNQITVTGNTVIDALLMEIERQSTSDVETALHNDLVEAIGPDWLERDSILVTGHRRENFGQGFEQICSALDQLANRFSEMLVVYPVHLNPKVQEVVQQQLGNRENIRLIAPQPYSQFVALARRCRIILTDSGGVQEEAPTLGKPVLVMRDTTERPEGVEAGTVKLVGASTESIVNEATLLLTDPGKYGQMASVANPYGDGHAAGRIVEAVRRFLD